ncbi:hypothetical protein N2152v2_002860 [Parachlorella kessleri]
MVALSDLPDEQLCFKAYQLHSGEVQIHSGSDEWFVLSKGLLQGLPQLRSLHLQGVELQADSDQDDDDDDDDNNDDDVAFSSQDAVEMWQHLEDLHITQVLPEESVIRALPRLPGLTSLYLHYGESEVEPELMQCILACNGLLRLALEFVEEVVLPALAPGQLTSLTSLELRNRNRLGCLPPSWCLPSLQELKIAEFHNMMFGFPGYPATLPEGPYLSNLRRLSLSYAFCLSHIPPALRSASELTELDLSHCYKLSLRQQDLQLLQSLKKLIRLNLTRHPTNPEFIIPGDVSIVEEASVLPQVEVEEKRAWEHNQMKEFSIG